MVKVARDRHLELLKRVRTVHMDEGNLEYEEILEALYFELESPTVLSTLLVEQVAQSMFWIKRHTQDKEAVLLREIAAALRDPYGLPGSSAPELATTLPSALEKGRYSDEFEQFRRDVLKKRGVSFEEVRAYAIKRSIDQLKTLDDLINRHIQNLRHLQKSLDQVDLKKRVLRRMDLEIERYELETQALLASPGPQ